MKIKYHEWKCLACGNILKFTGRDTFSPIPYWFTLKIGGAISSSDRPSFETTVCSISCLATSSAIIEDSINNHKYSIPNKKNIEATICDQCGKMVKIDVLNMIIGPSPLQGWTYEKTSAGRKDFCCDECKRNHTLHPEESVFEGVKLDHSWGMSRLIEAVDAVDFKEAIKVPEPKLFDASVLIEAIQLAEATKK